MKRGCTLARPAVAGDEENRGVALGRTAEHGDEVCSDGPRHLLAPAFPLKFGVNCLGFRRVERDRARQLSGRASLPAGWPVSSRTRAPCTTISPSPRSELALLPTDDDPLKLNALVTALVVRNAREDFHAEHLTDEQMKKLNPIIRDAIYTALYAIHRGEEEPWCRRFFGHHLKMIPPYWEAPELQAGAQKMRERERSEQEARLRRKMRRSQKAR